jgi:riboflavin biosynthesis pyrimidine reductase
MTRLELLHELPGLPRFDLPPELEEAYGGALGFDRPRLFANFVSTIDGVVAIPELAQSNKLIRAESESDRFVMGLLRAAADAVLIGSGTLRASSRGLWTPERAFPAAADGFVMGLLRAAADAVLIGSGTLRASSRGLWTPERAFPAAADGFAELRRRLGRPAAPERVVVTGTGSVPPSHPLFAEGALVLTTESGASRLEGTLPAASTIIALGDGATVDLRAAVAELRARGHELILSEAGPRAFGSLLEAGLVDELFLTVSPLIAGRGTSERLNLVEGFEALPGRRLEGRLLSARRDGAHLFLRYEIGAWAQPRS